MKWDTRVGRIEAISLRDFVEKLSKLKVYQRITIFEVLLGSAPVFLENDEEPSPEESFSNYTKEMLAVPDSEDLLETYRENILDQAKKFKTPKVVCRGAVQIGVEDAALHCVYNFGAPEYLVEIKPNLFLMSSVDESDLEIRIFGPRASVVSVYAPRKMCLLEIV